MVIVGMDEVGRGCWAGPLVAGAVILDVPIPGLTDSKQLSKKQRERLSVMIYEQAAAVGLGWVDAATIDDIGLTAATTLAMRRALELLAVPYEQVIIDGNLNYLPDVPLATTMIKADALVPAVSAASIIAKVARDTYMTELAASLPDYGFELHVGYGTALHSERLKKFGVSAFHRKSFKPVAAQL
jgi:ribonuclease HII